RNAYRAAAAHHAPRALGWDATAIDPGLLFQCPSALPARLLHAAIDGLAAELPGPRGAVLLRTIEIGASGLTIRDGVENGALGPLMLPPPCCRGYGKRTNTMADSRFFPRSAAGGEGVIEREPTSEALTRGPPSAGRRSATG
ncbi:MAG: hypothetical protein WB820_04040, partial [Rhodoplanes sp.]